MVSVKELDNRICDCCVNSKNTQTWREFITESENEFGLANDNIDKYTDEELDIYIEFLNYLWEK